MKRAILIYIIIIVTCIAAYIVSLSTLSKKIITKNISYHSNTAIEVYMVWGKMNDVFSADSLWPDLSVKKNDMLWSKMSNTNGQFKTTIKVQNGTEIYYWMVHTRDSTGNETEVWDAGGEDKEYYFEKITDNSILNPGFFILLAGLLPLILAYFNNRNKPRITNTSHFSIKEYIPQLDTIRAIAVMLVIIHHWIPKKSFLNFLPNGPLGVNIFFVLSGFLITGILLKAKKQAVDNKLNKGTIFKNFYIRRTLRIFPIYYLFLIVLWILKDPSILKDGIYYITYTSNFLFYSQQSFPAREAHLWSLGAEEQFYLIWPWLIILLNRKILPYIILLAMIVGISFNYIFVNKSWWIEITTPACLDAFAIGGFLSFLIAYRQDLIVKFQLFYRYFFLLAFAIFVLDIFNFSILPHRTVHSFLAIFLIYYCLFKNNIVVANYILNNKWLIRLGKISYGIYLYHLVIPELRMAIESVFTNMGYDFMFTQAMPEKFRPAWIFIQNILLLLSIASLSWKFIEKPINNLKDKFTVRPKSIPC